MALDLKRVPKWAWIVAALVAVGVYWYFKHRGASLGVPPQGTATPDDTASAAAGLPGTGSGGGGDSGSGGGGMSATDSGALASGLSDLAAQQQQFYADWLANQNGMQSAGMSPADWLQFTQQLLATVGSANPSPTPALVSPGNIAPVTAGGLPASIGGGGSVGVPAAAGSTSTIRYAGTPVGTQTSFTSTQRAAINADPNALRTIASDHPTTAAAGIHYYTYKSQVPLRGGQTLHFTSGRGYYAA